MCSTPAISPSTCSMGEDTRLSTCSAEAPGKAMKTLAKVTSICGSSSRGVTRTANIPNSSAARASNGVSWLPRNRRATRPLKPGDALIERRPDARRYPGNARVRSSRRTRACSLQFRCGGERIDGDPIAGNETGENLDAIAEALSEPHLTHRGVADRIHDVDRRDFATLDARSGRHQQPLSFA